MELIPILMFSSPSCKKAISALVVAAPSGAVFLFRAIHLCTAERAKMPEACA